MASSTTEGGYYENDVIQKWKFRHNCLVLQYRGRIFKLKTTILISCESPVGFGLVPSRNSDAFECSAPIDPAIFKTSKYQLKWKSY